MFRYALAAATALALSTPAGAASFGGYSSYWALGDSLSDDGNLRAMAPAAFAAYAYGHESAVPGTANYYDGRFSNGPTWVDRIAAAFRDAGLATDNFAWGYARAASPDGHVATDRPSLAVQEDQLSARADDFGSRPLVSMLMGANDLFNASGAGAALTAVAAARGAAATARELSALGVRDFLIANLPNLGRTPAAAASGTSAGASALTGLYNATLAAEIAALRAEGLNVLSLDLYAAFEDLTSDPAAYGFADVTTPCMRGPLTCTDAQSQEWLFFDFVHPNARAHAILGDQALALIAPVPLPGGLPLAASGIGLLVLLRRRRG